MKTTSLYQRHLALGAKMVPFAGYSMPVTYPGSLKDEYDAVRNHAGLFDVSHMGQIRLSGSGVLNFLQFITVNNVYKLETGQAQYSAMCYENGGIVDDLIVYKSDDSILLVVNASNIEKNLAWLEKNKPEDVAIQNESDGTSLIALQGPESRDLLKLITTAHLGLSFYTFCTSSFRDTEIMVSRTGYTGELGFEIYGNHTVIPQIWDILMDSGKVRPCGLAARDILRMEMKYCLYGNDIDENRNPMEAGLGWITDLNKGNFSGRETIARVQLEKPKQRLVAFIMEERGIPRHEYEIYRDNHPIGTVTSGTQSLGLKKGIGLGYINREFSKSGTSIDIMIRNKPVRAAVIRPPFIKNTSLFS